MRLPTPRRRPLVSSLSLALGTAMLALPQLGSAQNDDEINEIEEIVVTGSRIYRADLQANSPIAVFDAEELRITNTTNVEEFLRDMPQFVAAQGANGNNGNDGAATVDLRNLGEERTLVLVDGKRFVPYDYQGYVDLSMIPSALIERVEVITGGASAVYGSDAVGGVVNFIMKKNFSGVELDTSFFTTNESDGDRRDFALTVGGNIDGGKGNVVMNISYTDQEEVTQGQRDYSIFSLDDLLEPGGSSTHPAGTVRGLTGGAVQFDDNNNLSSDIRNFNFNPFNLLLAPQEKWTGTVLASYDVGNDVEVYARGSFANNQINTIIAPTGTFNFPYVVNVDNPFLSEQARAQFAANDDDGDGFVDFLFGRRLTELGNRISQYENTAYQFVVGVNGQLGEDWRWEAFGQRGRTSRTQNFLNDVNYANSLQAMLAVQNADGSVSCIDPSGGCVPANFFGENNLSPEAANFIRLNMSENNETTQTIWGASVTGETPWTLPSATNPIAVAAGIEIRNEDGQNRPDGNYAGGNGVGFGSSSPVDAKIDIQEVFGEAAFPIVEDSAVGSITLEAGVRYAKYENEVIGFGGNDFNNTSWKIGGDWTINDFVRLRGGFQKAVRAPTLREIGLPITPSTGDLDFDPCEQSNPVGNADLTALCIATGVPADNVGFVDSIVAGQINNFLGGEPSLEPEEAESITFGAVFTPATIPLTASIDYYEIEITDAIAQISEQNVVNACYDVERDPSGFFCSRVLRDPLTGGLIGGNDTGVNVSLINAAIETTSGVDIAVDYRLDLNEWGSLALQWNATHVLEAEKQQAELFAVDDCTGLVGNTCVRPEPEWRFIQQTRWMRGPLTVNLRWQYIDELTNDTIVLDGAPPSNFARPNFGSYSYWDLAATYDLNDALTLRAGIYNMFDKEPPIVGNDYGGTLENSGNTYPATFDPLGRSFAVGLTARL